MRQQVLLLGHCIVIRRNGGAHFSRVNVQSVLAFFGEAAQMQIERRWWLKMSVKKKLNMDYFLTWCQTRQFRRQYCASRIWPVSSPRCRSCAKWPWSQWAAETCGTAVPIRDRQRTKVPEKIQHSYCKYSCTMLKNACSLNTYLMRDGNKAKQSRSLGRSPFATRTIG